MSPGCNPLFLLLLLGAEFFQEFLSHPNSFVLRCACWGLIFGLLQHTMQHHITQPGPSERSRLLSVLNPSFHVSNTFFSQYGTELSVALGFLGGFFCPLHRAEWCVLGKWLWMNFNFCTNTEGDGLCIERCEQEQCYHIYYVGFFFIILRSQVLYRCKIKTAGTNKVKNKGIHFGLCCSHCGKSNLNSKPSGLYRLWLNL